MTNKIPAKVLVVFHFYDNQNFSIDFYSEVKKEEGLSLRKINVASQEDLAQLKNLEKSFYFEYFSDYYTYKHFVTTKINIPFSKNEILGNSSYERVLSNYYKNTIKENLLNFQDSEIYVSTAKKVVYSSISKVNWTDKEYSFHLKLKKTGNEFTFYVELKDEFNQQVENFKILNENFFIINKEIFYYTNDKIKNKIIKKLKTNKQLKFNYLKQETELLSFFKSINEDAIPIEFDKSINFTEIHTITSVEIKLSHFLGKYFKLTPTFTYDEYYKITNNQNTFLNKNGEIILINRDIEKEHQVFNELKNLHKEFEKQNSKEYLYFTKDEKKIHPWIKKTIPLLQEKNYHCDFSEVIKELKFQHISPNVSVDVQQKIDWFDVNISITWGEYDLPLKEIRKSILHHDNLIKLPNGEFVYLDEEFINSYSNLFKLGNSEQNKIKVNKYHIPLLDSIGEHLNEESKNEINNFRQNIIAIDSIQTQEVSNKIQATLRPYQIAGFEWLQKMDKSNFGACLADDMGLGKTLQTISFIQYLKENYENSKHLIILPTSLLFNWKNELTKFLPSIKSLIYYGIDRKLSTKDFEKTDIVITTYQIARNDIDVFKKLNWHYIIFDESHMLKNPSSKTYQAISTLNSINKIIISGTPLQNNTFDLYAQFNLVNKGMLGSMEYFREKFANPIDKFANQESKNILRQIINPFILRRTKEQVATDLPEKTIIIQWCELDEEQRKIYDGYKKYYRDKLLKEVEENEKSNSFYFNALEAIMRLRQICNHPKLLQEKEYANSNSVKLKEIIHELKNNISHRKVLVFSNFTSMLDLIKEELENLGISSYILTGSTSIKKREKIVEEFQTNEQTKVFLISMKAGGVGLTLTAAEYVYIVDPWWNPSVEKQAIDRTHRIGQSKNIFAYKMICKDTIEEKIHLLQNRKNSISSEMIQEETEFVKKLSIEDFKFLLE